MAIYRAVNMAIAYNHLLGCDSEGSDPESKFRS